MDLSILKTHASRAFAALLALTVCTGLAQATSLTITPTLASPSTISLGCNTSTGATGTTTFTVKMKTAPTGSSTSTVTLSAPPAGLTLSQTTFTFNSTNAAQTFTLAVTAPGCQGLTPQAASAVLFTFSTGGSVDTTVYGAITAPVATTSGLSVPSAVTVTCVKTGSTYAPGPATTATISSTNPLGTPWYFDTSGSGVAYPAWLSTPTPAGSSGTPNSTPTTVSFVSPASCGGQTTNTTVNLALSNAPMATDKALTVNFVVLNASPLTLPVSNTVNTPLAMNYTKSSNSPAHSSATITSTASPAPFFSVDTTTLPVWLTVDSTSGVAGAGTLSSPGKTLNFSSTAACDSIAPGTYSAAIALNVAGYAATYLYVQISITNSSPKLSVAQTTISQNWTMGTTLPAPFVTAISTDSPIPYTVTTGGPLAPIVASTELTGIAYSFGTPIPITFSQLVFASAQPGTVLTGTVSLTWGNPSTTTVVTINITVVAPGANVISVSPATVPTSTTAGTQFTLVLTGSGFVNSTDITQKTRVGVVTTANNISTITPDANITITAIPDSSHIQLSIVVPATADANLPFTAGGTVVLGACNPAGTTCNTLANGTTDATLTIGGGPIVQAVSSASTFNQISVANVAPYDMLSIFGSNFCPTCTSGQVLTGSPNATLNTGATAATLQYPTSASPDSGAHYVKVSFNTTGTATVLAYATILFATNNQINIVAPEVLKNSIGSNVDLVVTYYTVSGSNTTSVSSTHYPVAIVATDPGIYTVGADGQGAAAALNSTYSVINSSNPAGLRLKNGANHTSDTISLYVTGLGMPDSTNTNSGGSSTPGTGNCISEASYLSTLNTVAGLPFTVGTVTTPALTTLDGVVVQSSLLNTYITAPCILLSGASAPSYTPTVTVGGVTATVSYAGWVANSVAGLYQINVQLPDADSTNTFTTSAGTSITSANGALATPIALPVKITSHSVNSPSGVTLWVSQQLQVSAPTTLSGTVGSVWPSSSASVTTVSTSGSGTYTYAVTGGLLPAGLTLTGSGVNAGLISGTPIANTAGTYPITVTVTDTSTPPLTANVSFTLTVAGGLYLTSSAALTTTALTDGNGAVSLTTSAIFEPYGSSATVTTLSAASGTAPYAYAITSPGSIPAGWAVGAASGVFTIATYTPAGRYPVTVTATDANGLTGVFNFNLDVNMVLSASAGSATAAAGGTVASITATGYSGTPTCTLVPGFTPANLSASWSSSACVVTVPSGSTAGTAVSFNVVVKDSVAPSQANSAAAIGTLASAFTATLN